MSVRISRVWRVSFPKGACKDDIQLYLKVGESTIFTPDYIYGEDCDPVWRETTEELYEFLPLAGKKVTAKKVAESLDLFNTQTFLRESTEIEAWEKRFNLPKGTKVFFTNDFGRQTYVIG